MVFKASWWGGDATTALYSKRRETVVTVVMMMTMVMMMMSKGNMKKRSNIFGCGTSTNSLITEYSTWYTSYIQYVHSFGFRNIRGTISGVQASTLLEEADDDDDDDNDDIDNDGDDDEVIRAQQATYHNKFN